MGNKRTSRVAALSTGQPHLKQLRLADFARHRSPCAADSPDDSSCIAFSTTPQQESSGSESEDEMQRFSASKNCILCKGVKYFQCRSASEAICRFSEAQPRQPILLWYRCPCCTEWENVPPSELHDSQIKRETETPLTVPHDAPTGIELHTYVPQRINIDGASLNTLVRLIDKGISLDTAIEAARAYSLFAEAEIYANKVQLERAEYAEMAIAQNMSKELQAIQKKELQDFELAQVQQGLWQPCQDLIPAASLLWNHISCRAVFNADLLSKEWAGITTDSIFKCRANIYKWCSLAANCLKWWPNLPHNATERYLDIQMFPLLITCRLLNVYFKNLRSYEELQCAINMFSAVFRSSMEEMSTDLFSKPSETLSPPKCIIESLQFSVPDPEALDLSELCFIPEMEILMMVEAIKSFARNHLCRSYREIIDGPTRSDVQLLKIDIIARAPLITLDD